MSAGRNKVLVSEYFELADFEDRTTGQVILQSVLLDALNNARRLVGEPFAFLTAYRVATPKEVSEDASLAMHALGAAVVVATPSLPFQDAVLAAFAEDARIVATAVENGVRVEVGNLRPAVVVP
jgi:hypothetical protein